MKRKSMLMSLVLLVLFVNSSLADRTLERSEILGLLEQLTSVPRDTWITAGTIEGAHEEYRAAKVMDESQVKELISERMYLELIDLIRYLNRRDRVIFQIL